MLAHHYHKPENALRRAEEYVRVGKSWVALQLLQGLLQSRRHRTWTKTHETIMLRFVDLCIADRKDGILKEGLHQYRNICWQQAPRSLETIINHLLANARKRCADARAQSSSATQASLASIADLEEGQSPEAIMLSARTSEGTQDRSDKKNVVPWLRFTWNSFRAVMEILRNMKIAQKLEKVYHATAVRAFKFCVEYERSSEFRRLCEQLRYHLTSQLKRESGELRPESMEMHLQTRFEQLRAGCALKQWNEGFRTIEDINNIRALTKKTPSRQLMATFYQKLTQIFLVSEQYLFHAFTWRAYYDLQREHNKSVTRDQLESMATRVLLAALAVPRMPKGGKVDAINMDYDVQREKDRKMASLIGFDHKKISREKLLKNLVEGHGISGKVMPELRDLYDTLEVRFDPLTIVERMKPFLAFINADDELKVYKRPLERQLVLRLVEQLSCVYTTVRREYLRTLLKDLDIEFTEVERIVVHAVKHRMVVVDSVTFDHQTGTLQFGHDAMQMETLRSQLTNLAVKLRRVNAQIRSATSSEHDQAAAATAEAVERAELKKRVLEGATREAEGVPERTKLIENRKEENERQQARREEEARQKKRAIEQTRREQEAARLKLEAEKREADRKRRQLQELQLKEKRLMMQKMSGKDVTLEEAKMADTAKLIAEKREKDKKKRDEQLKRAKLIARRLDGMTRALREAELPKLKALYKEQQEHDRVMFAKKVEDFKKKSKRDHEIAIKEKARVGKMLHHCAAFEEAIMERRKAKYEQEKIEDEKRKKEERRQRKIQRAQKRKNQAEAEQERLAEEERRRREEEERVKKEAEAAERAAREREAAKREEERAAGDRAYRPAFRRRDYGDRADAGGGAYRPPGARRGRDDYDSRDRDRDMGRHVFRR